MIYKISYICTIGALLITVSTSYVLIVLKDRKFRGIRAQANDSSKLTMKIISIVGTQLISWISLVGATIYFTWISSDGVPDMVFETFATIIIPINSLLNPIFYSELYTVILDTLFRAIKKFIHSGPIDGNADPPDETQKQSTIIETKFDS